MWPKYGMTGLSFAVDEVGLRNVGEVGPFYFASRAYIIFRNDEMHPMKREHVVGKNGSTHTHGTGRGVINGNEQLI